ncbi:MAG: hypothetical protein Q4G04_02255 [bacterium]|nr:hypothetical protein [bacterium]
MNIDYTFDELKKLFASDKRIYLDALFRKKYSDFISNRSLILSSNYVFNKLLIQEIDENNLDDTLFELINFKAETLFNLYESKADKIFIDDELFRHENISFYLTEQNYNTLRLYQEEYININRGCYEDFRKGKELNQEQILKLSLFFINTMEADVIDKTVLDKYIGFLNTHHEFNSIYNNNLLLQWLKQRYFNELNIPNIPVFVSYYKEELPFEYDEKGTFFLGQNPYIVLNASYLDEILTSDMFRVLYHEIFHYVMFYEFDSDKCNDYVMWEIFHLLISSYFNCYNYYQKNYKNLEIEVLADIYGIERTNDLKKILDFDDFFTDFDDSILNDLITILYTGNKRTNDLRKSWIFNVESMNTILKNNIGYLQFYPQLNTLYQENGEIRQLEDLLMNYHQYIADNSCKLYEDYLNYQVLRNEIYFIKLETLPIEERRAIVNNLFILLYTNIFITATFINYGNLENIDEEYFLKNIEIIMNIIDYLLKNIQYLFDYQRIDIKNCLCLMKKIIFKVEKTYNRNVTKKFTKKLKELFY